MNVTEDECAKYFELTGKFAYVEAQCQSRAAFDLKYGLSKDDEKMAIKQAEAIIACVSFEKTA